MGKSFNKIGGEVEVETFIRRKARFLHKDRRERTIKGVTPRVTGRRVTFKQRSVFTLLGHAPRHLPNLNIKPCSGEMKASGFR